MSLWAKRYRHAVWRGLGQAYRLFPHFPLAIKAKAMARQVAQHCSFYARRPGRLMARHRGVFLTALVALYVDHPLSPPGIAFWAKQNGGRSNPGARIGRRAELPAPPGCRR